MHITSEGIIGCIHKGIRRGKNVYEGNQRYQWIDRRGGEAYLVDGICKELGDLYSATLFRGKVASSYQGRSFQSIMSEAEADPQRGRPPKVISGRKIADIALLDNQERPVCVIEVKREWNANACLQDIRRVYALLRKLESGSLQYGFFAVLLVQRVHGNRDMEYKIDRVISAINQRISNMEYNFSWSSLKPENNTNGELHQICSLVVEVFVSNTAE